MLRMKVTELPFFNLLYLVKKTPEVLKRRVLAQQKEPKFYWDAWKAKLFYLSTFEARINIGTY